MPLLHRRSYTRTDFRRLACRPRATPLGFEASICAGPRSSGPVIHLAQSRSPLRISCSSRVSLSRHRPPLSRLPSAHDVARSIFAGACIFRWSRSQSSARCRVPCSPGQSQMRSSCSSPSDPLLRVREQRFASRRMCFAYCPPCDVQLARTTSSVTAVAGLACFAELVTLRCFELRVASARSPFGDSSVRSRCSDLLFPSVAVSRVVASLQMLAVPDPRCFAFPRPLCDGRRSRTTFCASFDAGDRSASMYASSIMPAFVLARLSAIEPAHRHVRLATIAPACVGVLVSRRVLRVSTSELAAAFMSALAA